MRTLPTVTLQAYDHAGKPCWKAFFPFYDAGIRAVLEQYGMYCEEHGKPPALPPSTDDFESLRMALSEHAFLFIRRTNPALSSPAIQASYASASPAPPAINPAHSSVIASLAVFTGEERIKIAPPYSEKNQRLLCQLSGSRWCQTMQAWHFPKTAEAWQQLKDALPDIEVELPASASSKVKLPDAPNLKHHSESGLQSIFEKAREKSGVNPDLTIHGLRHCFGTHLQEAGVPLHEIKELMGHVNIATTEVYLHLSAKYKQQIQSPFQGLGL